MIDLSDVDRFEVIDHRQCKLCEGIGTIEVLRFNKDTQTYPCPRCEMSGIMGGRVYMADASVKLSLQDHGKTLKVFIDDTTNIKGQM